MTAPVISQMCARAPAAAAGRACGRSVARPRRAFTTTRRVGSLAAHGLPGRVPCVVVAGPPPMVAPIDGLLAVPAAAAAAGTAAAAGAPRAGGGAGSISTLYWTARRPRTAAVVWVNRKAREVAPVAQLVAHMQRELGLRVLVPGDVVALVGGVPYDAAAPEDSAELERAADFAVSIGNYDARAALSRLFGSSMPPVLAVNRRMHSSEGVDDLWRRVCVMLRCVCSGGFGVMHRLRGNLKVVRQGAGVGGAGVRRRAPLRDPLRPQRRWLQTQVTFLHDAVLHRAPHPTSVRLVRESVRTARFRAHGRVHAEPVSR